MPTTRYTVEVQPEIPERLERLPELAGNLIYSWDRRVRGLFFHMDSELWETCGHNPRVFLRRIDQERLEQLAGDRTFLEEYHHVLAIYDSYHEVTAGLAPALREQLEPDRDLVAYFCAEFGLHESLRLYSGGLGILAGDHCKAASDLGIPFVAVGLMYRQGYFTQTIDSSGQQVAHYQPARLGDLPIAAALDADGAEVRIQVPFPERTVWVKVWQAQVGHVRLLLLDTELPENAEPDRAVTYQLYGGGDETRIAQEMVLGIGGIRALRALDLAPTAWHVNEGHAAFMVLERCREAVAAGLDFDSALELVAAATVFTTHTPVAAGHDLFGHELMTRHFEAYVAELGIPLERFLALGESPQDGERFNMTGLALRGSRHHNGVSRIHGSVASRMEAYIWPDIPPDENPVSHVTNGVHVPTFLAREWTNLFDMRYQGWRDRMCDVEFWQRCVDDVPAHRFWSLRQSLKAEMLADVRERIRDQYQRYRVGAAHLGRLTASLSPTQTDVLVLGFARRFATYKRALLLFRDPARLARILGNPARPVVILFAGKAHPQDRPGQDLIRAVFDFALQPQFAGKVFFVEGHDMALARKLVTGVDVWLNTPQHPLEASGTSGQKAAINGVLNLSVLDGWWAEACDGHNGWGIVPHDPDADPEVRDRAEAEELLDILENEVIPLYFDRGNAGYPGGWVERSKRAMQTVLPRFNAQRMLQDYLRDHYLPAIRRGKQLAEDEAAGARALAAWKARVRELWPGVAAEWAEMPPATLSTGEALPLRVAVKLNGLDPDDVCVECVLGTAAPGKEFRPLECHRLRAGDGAADQTLFGLDLCISRNGLLQYEIRLFPNHPLLSHPFETGCMLSL
ncbi:MAG TPA: alpha-glucan family phosphorylase [Gammaproteobacteria bacterium]|nr:alpha-glucan family phosphorylase [Gammaproteobacteria bacterium]